MAVQVQFAPSAYQLLCLHAVRFGAYQVDGLLLGTQASPKVVRETLPLFHGPGPLAPMLEIALMQAEEYASRKGLQIVGYYHAAERLDHLSALPDIAAAIANKISQNISNPIILLIDNNKLTAVPKDAVFEAYAKFGHSWSKRDLDLSFSGSKSLDTVNKVLAELIDDRTEFKLKDFSQHLDDPRNDWFNLDLTKVIESLN